MDTLLIFVLVAFLVYLFTRLRGDGGSHENRAPAPAPATAPKRSKQNRIEFDGEFVRLGDFYGPGTASGNGDYIAACRDNYDAPGRVMLISGDGDLLWSTILERPNNVRVSNLGHVAVEDWRTGDSPRGTFYVFSQSGEILVQKKLRANILESGLSSYGSVACCATATNPDVEADSRKLFVFQLEPEPKLLFKRGPLSMAEYSLVSRDGESIVFPIGDAHGVYKLNLAGEVLNPDEARLTRIDLLLGSNQGYSLFAAAEEIINGRDPEELSGSERAKVLQIVDTIQATDVSNAYKAKAMRMKGEIQLGSENKSEALESFDQALAIDEKVGVKRISTSLRKELDKS